MAQAKGDLIAMELLKILGIEEGGKMTELTMNFRPGNIANANVSMEISDGDAGEIKKVFRKYHLVLNK